MSDILHILMQEIHEMRREIKYRLDKIKTQGKETSAIEDKKKKTRIQKR